MDLLRSAIKALFLDFNPSAVVESIMKDPNIECEKIENSFYEQLSELLSWREDKFTSSEAQNYTKLVKDSLLEDEQTEFLSNKDIQYTPYERIFLILSKCGDKILDIYGNQPKVRFDHLLRWRDLSFFIGEDALVLSTLARQDVITEKNRTNFLWPNVLGHNNMIINHILSRTLSDTHAHLWASTNIFEFNWLAVMNHPEMLYLFEGDNGDTGFLAGGFKRYYDRVNRYSPINFNMAEWIAIAAAIRIRLHLLSDQASYDTTDKVDSLMTLDFSSLNLKGDLIDEFKSIYDGLEDHGAPTVDGFPLDYAITGTLSKSPFCVLEGERKLLYNFFRRYFGGDLTIRQFAPWLYLYLLIRNKARREFVQVNELKGFLNFQTHQNIKLCFVDALGNKSKKLLEAYKKAAFRYAIQSSIIGTSLNNFEARISPESLDILESTDYWKSIFTEEDAIDRDSKHLSFVIHFLKKKDKRKLPSQDGVVRHWKLRKSLRTCLELLDKKLQDSHNLQVPVVGFDAAGNELVTPPEVFAPTFKSLRNKGYTNLTYHVGEDFYDIIHGLRSIDEAVEFLELSSGNRIGHGIALGVDARRYYQDRRFYSVLPKQVLLDNCVWLKYTAMKYNIDLQSETLFFIEENFEKLSNMLGYINALGKKGNLTMFHYWESMKLRDLDPRDAKIRDNDKNDIVFHLLRHYWESGTAFLKGSETTEVKLPKNIWMDVEALQEAMIRKIEKKGITIEANPSSNLKIGPFDRYENLPLFRLHSPGYSKGVRIPVTINTDDKGIFATSLENEYSLVALAMKKMTDDNGNRKWNDKEIEDYLRQLAEYGEMTRFQPNR